MPKCILAEQEGKGGGGTSSVVPTKLTITTNPTRLVYKEEDTFVIDGLKATVSYGVSGSALEMGTATIPEQIPYGSLSIAPNRPLTTDDTKVTISYSENDVTVSAEVNITVRSSSLDITPPTKSTYNWGEAFNSSGLVVKTLAGVTVTDYTMKIGNVTLTNGLTLNNAAFIIGKNTVDVSYTDNDSIEQTGIFELTINKVSLTVPAQSGSLTYNGNPQTPSWNSNYNSTLMNVSVTAQTNANTTATPNYSATFTIKDPDHYQWADGSTGNKTATWTIGQKTLATSDVSVSGTLTIDASNLTREVTITIPTGETGTITISPMSGVTGLTITAGTQTANSRKFIFKGDGNNAVTQKFTVAVTNGEKNYTAGNFADKFTISATYWEWGVDGGTADAAWFTGLKNYLLNHSGASIKTSTGGNILGTTKSVTLTSPVLGTTTHLIRVIGVDQDADNTVTFQTKNCLNEYTLWSTTAYSSSNTTAARWTDSACKAKAECINYYNAFPGKAAIKTVKKGTCPSTNDSRNGTPTYNDETVFLLSEREFGLDSYSPLSTANSTTSKAECTQGKNFSYAYYTSNTTRVMYKGDANQGNTSNYGYPWERSRYYYSSSSYPTIVCYVHVNGTANGNSYNYSYGLAPAFVIGN